MGDSGGNHTNQADQLSMSYDFANILFAGPCTARCYFCIGKQLPPQLNPRNLDVYPPHGLEALISAIWENHIPQVVFTGTTTDPQLYRHEARLLACLHQRLPPGTQFSLHTNGRQALRKMAVFNQYDRAAISFPSFNPQVYHQVMGMPDLPDLESILQQAKIPVKISCVVEPHNQPEVGDFLFRCQAIGVKRLVLRKLYGNTQSWSSLLDLTGLGLTFRTTYRGNPVFDFQGMEVTLWDFDQAESTSLNLFANGQLSSHYLLAQVAVKSV
jgi:hypothetical protein